MEYTDSIRMKAVTGIGGVFRVRQVVTYHIFIYDMCCTVL
jgi:hypothetical protein